MTRAAVAAGLLLLTGLAGLADEPVRYQLTTHTAGVHKIDCKSLGEGLPSALETVRLTHKGKTVLLWHTGRDAGRLTKGSTLYFVAPAHNDEHSRAAVFELVLNHTKTGSGFYRAENLVDDKSRSPAEVLPVTLLLERNRVRAPLSKTLFPLTKGPEHWYWLAIPPKGKKALRLPLALAPAGGPGRIGLRTRANRAAGTSILHVFAGDRSLGRMEWKASEAGRQAWAVEDTRTLEGELTLHNPSDATIYLDRIACVYRGLLAAGESGQVHLQLRSRSETGLRISGLGGPAILLGPGDGLGQTGIEPSSGKVTLGAGLAPGSYHLAELTKVVAAAPRRLGPNTLRDSNQQADYLMICPPALREALAPLVAHRTKEGLRVRVVDPAQIYEAFGHGQFGPNAIRSALRHALTKWKKPAPRYCLLVGDATGAVDWARPGAPIVPTGMVETYLNGQTASDTWLADTDGDHLPEISLGRLPAGGADELTTMVSKILRYETRPFPESWRRRISFITGPGRFNPAADRFLESLFSQLISKRIPDHFRVDVSYANPKSPYCPAPGAFNSTVLDRVNQGSLFLCYVGHGFRFGFDSLRVGRKRYPIMTVRDLDKVGIRRGLPIVTVIACSTAHFDGTEKTERASIGEGMIRHPKGPVAFIGATRISHPYANGVLGKELLDVMFGEDADRRLGPALDRARARLLKAPKGDGMRGMIDFGARMFIRDGPSLSRIRNEHPHLYVLLGDPAMRVRVPDAGLALTVPERARRGAPISVSGKTALATGKVSIELLIRRDKLLVPLEKTEGAADADAVMARNYKRANQKVAGSWTAKISDGVFTTTIELDGKYPAGEYRVVAFATNGEKHQVGSARIQIVDR